MLKGSEMSDDVLFMSDAVLFVLSIEEVLSATRFADVPRFYLFSYFCFFVAFSSTL